LAWRDGRLIFDGTPLAGVIAEINRYREGRIILLNEALGRWPAKAVIQLNDIDAVIALLRDGYNAKVTKLPQGIVILS
jgi:transmembrane sensor